MNELTNKMNYFISKFIDNNGEHLLSSNNNQSQPQNGNSKLLGGSGGMPPPPKPKLKYKNWCGQVEKKCHTIVIAIPSLETLNSNDEKKKEKAIGSFTKVQAMLNELLGLLEITAYKPSSKSLSIGGATGGVEYPQQEQSGSSSPSPSSLTSGVPVNSGGNNGGGVHTLSTSPKPTSLTSSVDYNNPSSGGNNSTSSGNSGYVPRDRESSMGGRTTNISNSEGSSSSPKEPKASTRVIANTCRESMLTLWGTLISFIEKFSTTDRDLSPFYATILLIAKRKEFDTVISTNDPLTLRPWNNDILIRYRLKLYKTFIFVANTVSHALYFNLFLTHFCAKLIALAFFRIPKVAKIILDALSPPETEITDIESFYPCPNTLKHLNIVGERPDKNPFHSLLMQTDSVEKDLDNLSPSWVDSIARKENLFFIFLKEWLGICKYSLGDSADLKLAPGFFTLVYALMHEIKMRDQALPPQGKSTPSLDSHFALINACKQDAQLLDAMIKIIFLKTCVFDLGSVAATLGIVELWIKEWGVLPETFDINFFCEGIDSIISADHHQVVIRALNLIYNTSDSFQGPIRRVLFSDLLLHKYFYNLFLHWDQPVRNAYHHILLYRMVRIKRSALHESGFSIGEFSKLTHSNTTVTKNSLSPTKYPEEKSHDHSYNSSSRLASSTSSISGNKQPKSPRSSPASPTSPQQPSSTSNNNSNPLASSGSKRVPPPVPPRNMSLQVSSQQEESLGDSGEIIEQDILENQELNSPRQVVPREALEKHSSEYSIDLELFLEIEIYIKKVTDQFRTPELKYHDPKLSTYVAASLSEIKTYIAHGNQVPPKIIPLMQQGPTLINLNKLD